MRIEHAARCPEGAAYSALSTVQNGHWKFDASNCLALDRLALTALYLVFTALALPHQQEHIAHKLTFTADKALQGSTAWTHVEC